MNFPFPTMGKGRHQREESHDEGQRTRAVELLHPREPGHNGTPSEEDHIDGYMEVGAFPYIRPAVISV